VRDRGTTDRLCDRLSLNVNGETSIQAHRDWVRSYREGPSQSSHHKRRALRYIGYCSDARLAFALRTSLMSWWGAMG